MTKVSESKLEFSHYGALDDETLDTDSTKNLVSQISIENYYPYETASTSSNTNNEEEGLEFAGIKLPSLRRIAMEVSLYTNLFITLTKLVAYIQTLSLSVLAALLDSVLDVVSQLVLNYTEKHSTMSRSSAFYPAGASRLEPIGVLTCAALMVRF